MEFADAGLAVSLRMLLAEPNENDTMLSKLISIGNAQLPVQHIFAIVLLKMPPTLSSCLPGS